MQEFSKYPKAKRFFREPHSNVGLMSIKSDILEEYINIKGQCGDFIAAKYLVDIYNGVKNEKK